MVKTRLIPVLNIKNGLIVRSEDFSYHQNIGNIVNEAQRYNEWDVDELIYLDISRSDEYDLRRDDHKISSYSTFDEIIQFISSVCFMPLTFGGKIRSIQDVDLRIKNGADKVSINTAALETPGLISEISNKYGAQCVVVSIDYKIIDQHAIVYSTYGTQNTGIQLLDWITECERLGAGEILINSIDRDGKANGFDTTTIGLAVAQTSLPIIACGGAGDFYDFVDLVTETKVSAVAAGNIFHFTERSYPRAKQLMKKNNINVR
jgi:cyclase